MLTPNQLERASPLYRKGYLDGYFQHSRNYIGPEGTFAYYDYHHGFAAGKNDRYWDEERSQKYKAAAR